MSWTTTTHHRRAAVTLWTATGLPSAAHWPVYRILVGMERVAWKWHMEERRTRSED